MVATASTPATPAWDRELDPRLLRWLGRSRRIERVADRHFRGLSALRPLPRLPDQNPPALHIQDPHEYPYNERLSGWLSENVPQALLRDLFRPIEYYYYAIEKVDDGRDPAAVKARALFRQDRWHAPPRFRRQALETLDEQRHGHRELLEHEWKKGPPKGPVYTWLPPSWAPDETI
jgi:hypothetical protein